MIYNVDLNKELFFSIVIPVYNVESYLEECVESVLTQGFDAIEIILVNDGSKDTSGKICDEFAKKDSRVQVIHKANGGLSSARNAGIAAASGKYILFLDSDDYYCQGALSILSQWLKSSGADCIAFGCKPFSDGAPVVYSYHREKTQFGIAKTGVELVAEMMAYDELHVNAGLYAIKRSFLLETGLSFYDRIIHEDELFSFLLFLHCDSMLVIADQLYFRRCRGGSIMNTRKYQEVFLGLVTTYREICRFMNDRDAIDIKRVCKSRLRVIFNQLQNLYNELPVDAKRSVDALYKEMIQLSKENLSRDDTFVWLVSHFNRTYNFYKSLKRRA
jgi:glycosyltransferase involved in cell wall biosynthesis